MCRYLIYLNLSVLKNFHNKLKIPFCKRKSAIIITINFGIVTDEEIAIIIPEIISKKLIMLKPNKKIKPLIKRIKPRIKINLLENKSKIPNSQKHTAMKISKIPKALINIIFL